MKIVLLNLVVMIRVMCMVCCFSGVLLAGNGRTQGIDKVNVTLDLRHVTMKDAFLEIDRKTEFSFVISKEALTLANTRKVTIKADNVSVAKVLKDLSRETGASFRQRNDQIIVNAPVPPPTTENKVKAVPAPFKIIRGKITDENGAPLPGANVLVKGTIIGAVADVEGNYAVDVPDEADTLLISFVGYITKEIVIGSQSVIDIMLTPDITSLNEVIVSTGYWKVDQKLNPGNIGKVTASEIEQQPITNPLLAIQGRVAGVQIQETSGIPGSAVNIQIRGKNSIRNGQFVDGEQLQNGNLPFYVIDGVPYLSSSLNSDFLTLSNGNPLTAINPSDIESIEILKDADATAIYGSRGANGVVLITTKKGRSGKTQFNVNLSQGIGEVANRVDLLNTEQYIQMRREGLQNDGFWPPPGFIQNFYPDLFVWDSTRFTDWQDELIGGTANQTNASLSVSGGNAQTQFLISGDYFRQTTVFPDDNEFKRGSGRVNINHRSRNNKFRLNASTQYITNSNGLNIDFTFSALTLPPSAPALYDSLGNLNWENSTFNNPLGLLGNDYENTSKNLISNALLFYELIPGLYLKGTFGYNNLQVEEISTNSIVAVRPSARSGRTGTTFFADGATETWSVEPQIEYNRSLDKGQISLLVGATFQESITQRQTIQASGYTSDALLRDILSASEITLRSTNYSQYRYNAAFARINFSWQDKYIINLTGRRDGSSRFGPGNQFGNFGAIGGAWVFSSEQLVRNSLPFLSFGKIRGSYGTTGNDQIGDYQYLNSYEATEHPYGGVTGLVLTRLSNPDYSWETNKKLEAGLELGLFNNRISVTTSWFRNRSSNQLIGRPLPITTGQSSIQFNLPALIENRGWELELGTINVQTDDFQWSSSANLTIPENELVDFPNIETFPGFDNLFEVGRSLSGFKGYTSLGVNPETGQHSFLDMDADGGISSLDRQNFIEIDQEYFGGVNNSFRFKSLQLDVFFQFVKQDGRDFLLNFGAPGSGLTNQHTDVVDRWQNFGDITDTQLYTANNSVIFYDRYRGSDASVVDASFIRLQNVSLSWYLPENWINKLYIENSKVFLRAQNLLTITPYKGLDPESQSTSLPPLRFVTTGIQLTF